MYGISMNHAWIKLLPDFIRTKIEGRDNLQRILHNTGWLFADKILRMGVGLVVGVWVARYLGPEQFGAFNYAIAFVALFGAFASLGLDGIVVRDIVREPERKLEILSSAFILKLCGGCVAFSISLGAIFIMRPADSQTHWLVGIIAAGMIFQSFDAIDLWFQSQVQSKYTVLAKNGAFLILAVVRVFLILNKAPLTAFAYAALAEIIIGAIGLIWFFRNTHFLFTLNKNELMRIVIAAFPLFIQVFLISVNSRIDQVVIGSYLTTKDLGIYSAASRITEIFYFLPTVIGISVFPYIASVTDKRELENKIIKVSGHALRLCILIYVIILVFSDNLISVLYGNKFAEAGNILKIYSAILLPVYYGIAWSQWILLEQKQKLLLLAFISSLVSNVILLTILTPRYGVIGVAFSPPLAAMVGQSTGIFLHRPKFAFKLIKGVFKI